MRLSLIIPCYNEEGNVENMYRAIEQTFLGTDVELELIYVNDGSRDQTLACLKKLLDKKDFCIKIVDFARNFGKEAAIYAGLCQATGDYTALIDGDLQQPPALVLDMVDFLEKNEDYDCVAAFQEKRKESAVLKWCKGLFYKIINRATKLEFVNGTSDFRTFRRSMVDAMLSLSERNRFTKGIFSWVGFRTHYVPYVAAERTAGQSKWSFRKLFRYAMDGIVSFSNAPLKFAKYTGVASVLFSIVYLIILLIRKYALGYPLFNEPVKMLIILMGGLNLIAIAILGEYVARIFAEVKQRPIYVARKVLTNSDNDPKK